MYAQVRTILPMSMGGYIPYPIIYTGVSCITRLLCHGQCNMGISISIKAEELYLASSLYIGLIVIVMLTSLSVKAVEIMYGYGRGTLQLVGNCVSFFIALDLLNDLET